jgi:hypothetical protein
VISAVAGARIAIVDSASATASALSELLGINGLEAPGTTRGTAADAGHLGHQRPAEQAATPAHVQLTTGDVEAFRTIARRLFGEAFPEIEGVELGRPRPGAGGPADAADGPADVEGGLAGAVGGPAGLGSRP